MTCKDCIHCALCDSLDENGTFCRLEPEGWDGNICKFFLHSMMVPLAIGQSIWKLCSRYRSPAEIVESRVSMIQQKADKSWKIRISNRYGTEYFKASDVGTYIFLTKEEAEAALAKQQEENNEAIL